MCMRKKISFIYKSIKLHVDIIIIILKQLTTKISTHEIKKTKKKKRKMVRNLNQKISHSKFF